MNKKERFLSLWNRYVIGECSPDELDELFESLEDPEISELIGKDMSETWNQEGVSKPPYDTAVLLEKINQTKTSHLRVTKRKRNKQWKLWSSIAAILVLSLLGGGWFWNDINQEEQEKWQYRRAEIGEVVPVVLPDGSKVWLNAASEIRYLETFSIRNVEVIGEAYFEVEEDKGRPFTVKTGSVTTRVLGTSFNVRAYQEDHNIQVTVKTGKVGVGKRQEGMATITPNQQISYSLENDAFAFSEVDASSLCSWRNGDLIFENSTFQDAVVILEKHFGKLFKFENERLKTCRFTSKFSGQESLDHILEVLSKLNGVTYRVEDGTVYFDGKKCL
ncbi:FecR family protein [Echinicola rosea]|uniref:Iron dicitrate transporter FecR n=1 Tax=Echinicola rosea TaxID=1807691 RepID=A0ABQ1V6C6_9BACT|nr:FecR family protein [Echinicola rosea]GGF40934.1 iron dicitrate transporter FecR [Echinicola rosea]